MLLGKERDLTKEILELHQGRLLFNLLATV